MTRINHQTTMFVYQQDGDSLEGRRTEFKKMLAAIATSLREWAISKQEKSVCDEVIRGRALSIDGLETLCTIAARSEKPFVLENAIQGAVLRRMEGIPPLCVTDTLLTETRAQSDGDENRILFHVERTPVRRDQALDAMGLHRLAIERDMAALQRWDYKGWGFSAPTNGRGQ
jgi:hypothetical protein